MNADHIVKAFDRDLDELDKKIIAMGKACEEQLLNVSAALKSCDSRLAERIVWQDDSINSMQKEIEAYAVFLIAKRQPVARDLRHAISGFKVSSNLERVGDYAVNVAKRILEFQQTPLMEAIEPIVLMVNTAGTMMVNVLEALRIIDIEMSIKVWMMDDEIDRLYADMMNRLKQDLKANPDQQDTITLLMQIVRHCERIGDHITNIAEHIYYIKTGETYIGNLD